MTYTLACGDVVPECQARFEDEDRDALLHQVADHAAADHGLTEIDDATRAAIDDAVVEVPEPS